jgi:hypothetical protein
MTGSELQEKPEKFWTVKFRTLPYEVYAYGVDMFSAMASARDEIGQAELVGGMVRPAVFGELDFGPEHFTNGGQFIRDTSKPCRECSEPVPFHTHKEELGYCQPCQAQYFNHTCAKCGEENVNNWDGNPFTRYCDECEASA